MHVLVNGLPLFSKRLVQELNDFDPSSSYVFLDTYNSKWAQIKFMLMLPFADAVISLNGITDKSGSMSMTLKWKKKLIMQWMGTDALLALERFENKTIYREYIDNATHFVDSIWLKNEVESLGVKADFLYFKSVKETFPVQQYDRWAAVSYVGQSRQAFYGLPHIISLAKTHPEIDFHVYGTGETEYELPANVTLHGWVKEEVFWDAVKHSPLFLRLTDHDGFSVAVIEALSYGAEVIMSLPFELAQCAQNEEERQAAFVEAIRRVKAREMKPNVEAILEIQKRFHRDHLINTYIQKIKEVCGK